MLKVVPGEIASTTSTLYSLILLSASILGRWSGLAYQNIPKKRASHFGMNWWNGMGTLCHISTIYARIVDEWNMSLQLYSEQIELAKADLNESCTGVA